MKIIKKRQHIYLIGIKGVGMTMLAQFLREQGNIVSGSDITDVFLTDKVLKKERIPVYSPFSEKNIPAEVDLVIYSSAYNANNNVEMALIKSNPERFKNVPILPYAAALGGVFNQYDGVAVCGSHGKTTTSAWLGYVLWQCGKKPSVLVGSRVPQFKGSSLKGESKCFVAEVDEYQNKLQYFQPHGVVLNNIDYDHPDFFKTEADYQKVFSDFIKKIPPSGFLVTNNQDAASRQLKKYCRGKVISYGLATGKIKGEPDYVATSLRLENGYQIFQVSYQGRDLGDFKISLWGEHNILNALAVIAASRELKITWPAIKKNLSSFTGTERRGQILGKYRGALIIDDYAHHPTEIRSTLSGLRRQYADKNIITVFHPHTFTRTKALFSDFAGSFSDSDELIVLDIYGSAREKQGGVSSRQLTQAISKSNRAKRIAQAVKHIATIPSAAAYLKAHLKKDDILLLMGAGDVFRVADNLLKKK